MRALARLVLLAALPALAGRGWCVEGDVVSVVRGAGAGAGAAGAGPSFLPVETALVAARGQDVELECRVRALGDKAVSWVRSRDLQILSHAGAVFTADARVSVRAGGGGGGGGGEGGGAGGGVALHTLCIQGLRLSDAGRYECQLNTDPKMSLFYNLTVLDEPVPVAVISAVGPREAAAAAGGAATLACEARYRPPPRDLPLPPLDIIWTKDGHLLDLQSARGGVSLDTERWAWRVVSRLTLAHLTPADGGAYTCALATNAAGEEPSDNILLLVQPESQMEAMQRDQSADNGAERGARARSTWGALALLALLTHRLYDT